MQTVPNGNYAVSKSSSLSLFSSFHTFGMCDFPNEFSTHTVYSSGIERLFDDDEEEVEKNIVI